MYVCVCRAVTDGQIRKAAQAGARSVGDLSRDFGLGRECGRCVTCAKSCLAACHTDAKDARQESLALAA